MFAIRVTFNNESKFYAQTEALWSGEKNHPVTIGTKSVAFTFDSEIEAEVKANSLRQQFPDTHYSVVSVTPKDRLTWKTIFSKEVTEND